MHECYLLDSLPAWDIDVRSVSADNICTRIWEPAPANHLNISPYDSLHYTEYAGTKLREKEFSTVQPLSKHVTFISIIESWLVLLLKISNQLKNCQQTIFLQSVAIKEFFSTLSWVTVTHPHILQSCNHSMTSLTSGFRQGNTD